MLGEEESSQKGIKKMKGGKTACMDSVIVEMLENRGISIIDWLLKYFRARRK